MTTVCATRTSKQHLFYNIWYNIIYIYAMYIDIYLWIFWVLIWFMREVLYLKCKFISYIMQMKKISGRKSNKSSKREKGRPKILTWFEYQNYFLNTFNNLYCNIYLLYFSECNILKRNWILTKDWNSISHNFLYQQKVLIDRDSNCRLSKLITFAKWMNITVIFNNNINIYVHEMFQIYFVVILI